MRLSKNAKLYYDANWDYALPDWQEIVSVQDLTLSEAHDEANVTDRESSGFTQIEPTLRNIELSFSIEANAQAIIFLTEYVARDALLLKVSDSDDSTDSDHTGILGWFKVTSFGRDQSLSDSQKINITAKPSSAPADEPLVYLPLPIDSDPVSITIDPEDESWDMIE